MKTWTSIVAASAVLAIAATAADSALAQIPREGPVYLQHQATATEKLTQVKGGALRTGYRVGNGVYGPYSYDPGRAGTKVAPAAFGRMAH